MSLFIASRIAADVIKSLAIGSRNERTQEYIAYLESVSGIPRSTDRW
jgi:hypothetical protein